MLLEIVRLLQLQLRLTRLRKEINKLIKQNKKLIKENSKLLIQLNIMKQPFDDTGDLTDSAFRMLMNEVNEK